ncbi:hypothetical protein BJY52DRAFT_1288027, partial [Lactarius psammicola]
MAGVDNAGLGEVLQNVLVYFSLAGRVAPRPELLPHRLTGIQTPMACPVNHHHAVPRLVLPFKMPFRILRAADPFFL